MSLIPLKRQWNSEGIAVFDSARDAQRSRKGLKPFNRLQPSELNDLKSDIHKSSFLEDENYKITFQSCPLEKYPLQYVNAPADGFLLCPQTYSISGKGNKMAKIHFERGENLYLRVYSHYSQPPTDSEMAGVLNYDGIGVRRHEFLGPEPCVFGFRQLSDENWEILFYDPSLKLNWCGSGKWLLGAEFDETVHSWFATVHLHGL